MTCTVVFFTVMTLLNGLVLLALCMLVKNSFSINNYRAIDSQCQLGPAQFVPAEDKSECKCVYVLVVCECVCIYVRIYVGPSVWGGRLLYACLTTYKQTSILLYHAGKQLKVVGTVELSFQRHSATVLAITFNQLTKTNKKAFNGGV